MLKIRLKLNFFMLLLLTAHFSFAAELADQSNLSQFQFDDHFSQLEKNLNLDFSLLGIQYFSAAGSEKAFQQKAEFALLYKKNFSGYDFGFDAFAGTYAAVHSTYFSLAEAFAGVRSENEKNYVYVGRKVEHFSAIDESLNIGLFNPYFSDDYVQFRTLGLVGIHTQAQASIFGFNASYLPFYLPNQGPQVYADNGQIKSPSRWAQKPPAEFQFGSQNKEIIYTIKDYNTNDIIKNGGYSLSTFVGLSDVRPWLRLS